MEKLVVFVGKLEGFGKATVLRSDVRGFFESLLDEEGTLVSFVSGLPDFGKVTVTVLLIDLEEVLK